MNKAKAMFTAGIIVIVAGASALGIYLNEKGIIGVEPDNVPESNVEQNDDYENNNGNNDYYNENNDYVDKSDMTIADNNDKQDDNEKENDNKSDNDNNDDTSDYQQINDFLSIFTKLYFSENKKYSEKTPDSYELLRFAFQYEKIMNNRNNIVTKYTDDSIGVYEGMKVSDVESIIGKFFGISVEQDSVYTESTYSFFKYENGYFYTPAADGVGFDNLAIAKSVTKNGAVLSVEFSVYSDGVTTNMTAYQAAQTGAKYANGRAELRETESGYVLIFYSLN